MTAALADTWAAERPRLVGLAYRILGSWHDAEDVVSQAWLRLAGQEGLQRPEAWLTTVTTRLAIDSARRSATRRETYPGPWLPEPVATQRLPEEVAEERSMLRLGMVRLLQELDPESRAILVLREAFAVPYDEIAETVGRSPAACRQVVTRAKARLGLDAGAPVDAGEVDERLLTALVSALVDGDVAGATRLVSDDCVLWTDGGGVTKAALRPVLGADKVVRFLLGVTGRTVGDATWAFVDVNGQRGLWFTSPAGDRLAVLEHRGGVVTGIQLHANPEKLGRVAP